MLYSTYIRSGELHYGTVVRIFYFRLEPLLDLAVAPTPLSVQTPSVASPRQQPAAAGQAAQEK